VAEAKPTNNYQFAFAFPYALSEAAMNLDPLHNATAKMTGLVSSVAGIWPDLGAGDGAGLVMPALAGVAAAVTLALALAIYFQTGYRSYRDMIRHGLAAAIGLALMAFVIYDMRNAAMAYLVRTERPTAQFELQWQKTTERAKELAAEMDRHTNAAVQKSASLPEARQG
jgi:hypothetical protein